MRKLKYSHFKKKPIITYSDGSAFQWNQLRSCTGLSQRHSFRLRFCSRRFVNSRPPSVPHHKLQHNHINELRFLYLVFPHIRLLLFSSAAIASVLQYDTFPAFVPSPTRSTGAPPTRRVTASVVLADALHLAFLTKTSTRAHCMKERKKDWSTTAICSKLHEKSTKFPWHFFTAIQPWVNTEEPAVSGSGVIFLLPVKTWLQAYEFVENYPSDFYHVPSLYIQTASF